MDYYTKIHCYPPNCFVSLEGNVVILQKKKLKKTETPTEQLWILLEQKSGVQLARRICDGKVKSWGNTAFHGVVMRNRIHYRDKEMIEHYLGNLSDTQRDYWKSKKFSPRPKENYRISAEIEGYILAVQLLFDELFHYSIWKRKGASYELVKDWGDKKEFAETDFAICTGLMKEEDLP